MKKKFILVLLLICLGISIYILIDTIQERERVLRDFSEQNKVEQMYDE